MTDVKDLLINTLNENFPNYPVYLQGSLSIDEAYPDSFFTFWNNDSNDEAFFDNKESQTIWDFDLNFYSNDPDLVNIVLLQTKAYLKAVGFIPNGNGYDVMSDEVTHTGRGMNLLFIQKYGK